MPMKAKQKVIGAEVCTNSASWDVVESCVRGKDALPAPRTGNREGDAEDPVTNGWFRLMQRIQLTGHSQLVGRRRGS
jgi:hypothetical protein